MFYRKILLVTLLSLLIQPVGVVWLSGFHPINSSTPTVMEDLSLQAKATYDFSFVWMSDTQYYSEQYPWIYDNMTQWIVNMRDEMNIEYVIHTGDIVQTAAVDLQWQRANHSMRILDDAEVPYGVLGGNHDGQDGFQNYYKYFGPQRFQDKAYYHDGGSGNHYDLITANGVNFVVVYLSYGINSSERAWASKIFQTYHDRIGILAVHEYIYVDGSYRGDGSALNTDVVVPNDNVYLILCGHHRGAQVNVKSAGFRTYYEILSDYQGLTYGGNGYLKILYFDIPHDQVQVKTYSTMLNQYGGTGCGYDEFTLTLPMTPTTHTVTFATDPPSGTIMADGIAKPNGTTMTYDKNQRVHIVAIPPSGYSFSCWEVSRVSVDDKYLPDTYMTVFEDGWLKAHFVPLFTLNDAIPSIVDAAENEIYFIYPDYRGVKPPGVAPALLSDWTATGFILGMCRHLQYETTDTDPSVVDTGNGALKLQGKGVVLFGGPLVNAPVHYYEANRIAPLYFGVEGGKYYWYRRDGTRIDATGMAFSDIRAGNKDMFVIESFIDPDGNHIFIVYGYGWKGTFAGGKFLKFVIYPYIGNYTCSYYVFKWVDDNGDGFVDLDEIITTPIVQG